METTINSTEKRISRSRFDISFCVFFFQAEDGIRDVAVTGVQTCALPIYNLKRFVQGLTVNRPAFWATEILHVDQVDANRVAIDVGLKVKTEGKDQAGTAVFEIGRASCRERVWV